MEEQLEEKHRYIYGGVTEDNHYLIITPRVSTSGNKLYIKDLTIPNAPLVEILRTYQIQILILLKM